MEEVGLMAINVSLNVAGQNADFERGVVNQLAEHIQGVLGGLSNKLTTEIRQVVREAIEGSPEYQDLLGGRLRELFGLEEPVAQLERITELVLEGIVVTYLPPSGRN